MFVNYTYSDVRENVLCSIYKVIKETWVDCNIHNKIMNCRHISHTLDSIIHNKVDIIMQLSD